MSYFDKYLKYKTLYLELKKIDGGSTATPATTELENFVKGSMHPVTFDVLTPYFSKYCWVGKSKSNTITSDYGFFLYIIVPINIISSE